MAFLNGLPWWKHAIIHYPYFCWVEERPFITCSNKSFHVLIDVTSIKYFNRRTWRNTARNVPFSVVILSHTESYNGHFNLLMVTHLCLYVWCVGSSLVVTVIVRPSSDLLFNTLCLISSSKLSQMTINAPQAPFYFCCFCSTFSLVEASKANQRHDSLQRQEDGMERKE